MLLYSVAIALIAGVASDNVHYVLSNDKLCVRLPCRDLQYFIDNSHRYFISNSKFIFAEGTYHHVKTDLIIQNVANISFIGVAMSNTSSPTSIIQCFPEHTIKFHSVQNIIITNILFKSCGNEEAIPIQHSNVIIQPSEFQPKYWAGIFFIECDNITVHNVYIDNPIGYGIILANVIGRNILRNMTIIIRRNEPYQSLMFTCSNGINVIYSGRKKVPIAPDVIIFGIMLMQTKTYTNTHTYCDGVEILAISLKQENFAVNLMISNSIFHQLHGNIIKVDINSFANNSIHFSNCEFTNNTSIKYLHLIDILYKLTCYTSASITITDCNFTDTNFYNPYIPSAILHFEIEGNYRCNLPQYDSVIVNVSNVKFYRNRITLLQVLLSPPVNLKESTIVTINTASNFIVLNNHNRNRLILVHYTKLHLGGKSTFIGNSYSNTIIHGLSSKFMFSNYTLFFENCYCDQLIRLEGKWQYIVLKDFATIKFFYNELYNELVTVPIIYNHPFRYCLFQFTSNAQNDFYNFNISFLRNTEKKVSTERGNSTLNQLSSHCKWINETSFQNADNLAVYNRIITHDKVKLGIHTTVCYCHKISHYNCSVSKLGPIYPGQTLTVNFCLPYNYENNGLLYAETYNDNLPVSACKIIDQDNLKYTFTSNHTRSVDFTIMSNSPTKCKLFLTAQPDLYTSYDVFNIQLLSCPLGFAFRHGICDCDPLLSSYTEKCIINDQIVKRLPNHWITGNTSNTDTKYLAADSCPIGYCSHNMMVNVHWPDAQCQQHRTGPLCSHCTPGYSVVLGSSRCKKCTNTYLILILLFLLTGVLMVVFLFVSNLTVTTGTINGLILFVNIVEMNGHLFELQNRLVNPLLSYVIVTNSGMCFELCFFDGMNIYMKKWLQLAYPAYLAMIAVSFIIASRYSSKLYRLTHNRSLPVLATLFMLTYTNVLQIISSVFLYTTITSLPSKDSHIVWSLDPAIPILGWKFMLLIIVCLLLFLFLLILNAVLLFTKPLMRFKMINRFKPIIDAFQGPFKHHCYYWIGLHLLIRNIMFLLSALLKDLSIAIGCIIIITISVVHGYIQPYKSSMINFQESLLLYNYSILCVLLLLNDDEFYSVIVLNVMVGLSMVHFLIIIAYHVFTYVFHAWLPNMCKWYKLHRGTSSVNRNNIEMDREQFENFQEPLLGQD